MPPATSQANRHSFASAGPPQPGTFRPAGAPRRTTSRGMNDAVIRASNPPRVRPRTVDAAVVFRQLTHTGLSFITAYAQFSDGVIEGLEDSLKGAWGLVSHDMWQWRTYTELATTVTALGLIQPFNIPAGLADAQAFDRRWGTHVTQRQVDIMAAINQLVQDVPRWTPRQWGRAVGRLVGDMVLAKGAGAAVRVAVSESVQISTIATELQKLGTLPAGATKLAKARAILPVYSRFTSVRLQIPFRNVATLPGKSAFWSGLEGGPGVKAFQEAEMLARANGRTSLEMTNGGKWLTRQTELLDGKVDWRTQMRPQWGRLSRRFAQRVSGRVEVYRGPFFDPQHSIWSTVEEGELNTLKQAGRVTDIHINEIPKK